MNNTRINLLPKERQSSSRRGYLARRTTVALLFIITIITASAALLLPTYIWLKQSEQTKTTHLSRIESSLSSMDEKELAERLSELSLSADILKSLSLRPSISGIIRSTLDVPRPGITISGLGYSPASGKSQSSETVSGTAATRDALRDYQIALSGLKFVKTADLPVSAYAKDTNIAFTITLTLVPSEAKLPL